MLRPVLGGQGSADGVWLRHALLNQLFYHHLSAVCLDGIPPDRTSSFQHPTLGLPGLSPSSTSRCQQQSQAWEPLTAQCCSSQLPSSQQPFPSHFPSPRTPQTEVTCSAFMQPTSSLHPLLWLLDPPAPPGAQAACVAPVPLPLWPSVAPSAGGVAGGQSFHPAAARQALC